MGLKITELPAGTTLAATDLIPIVEDASTTTKKLTATQFRRIPVFTVTGDFDALAEHIGGIVRIDSASPVTATIPDLGEGANIVFKQVGAGSVTFAVNGTTMTNRQGHTTIAGQGGVVGIMFDADGEFTLYGDTAA